MTKIKQNMNIKEEKIKVNQEETREKSSSQG